MSDLQVAALLDISAQRNVDGSCSWCRWGGNDHALYCPTAKARAALAAPPPERSGEADPLSQTVPRALVLSAPNEDAACVPTHGAAPRPHEELDVTEGEVLLPRRSLPITPEGVAGDSGGGAAGDAHRPHANTDSLGVNRESAPPPEAGLREALLTWFDTTHGNEFGHDHHCPAPWNEQPHAQPIFEGCTCGWSDVQRAEAARDRLLVSPADPEEAPND